MLKADFFCGIDEILKENEQLAAFLYEDYSVQNHSHEFYEMNIIMSGRGQHVIEGHAFSVRRGDVFIISPGLIHCYEKTEKLNVFHILFRPSFLREYASEQEKAEGFSLLTEIEPYLRSSYSQPLFLHLSASCLMGLQSDFEIITRDSQFDAPQYRPLQNHTALKLLYYCSALLARQTYGEKAPSSENEQAVMRVLEYIHANYAQKITLQKLCEISYMTRSTLLRHFTALCGCSPSDYLIRFRIRQASHLLEQTDRKKTDIAVSCGFYDLSHFERAIAASTGRKDKESASWTDI